MSLQHNLSISAQADIENISRLLFTRDSPMYAKSVDNYTNDIYRLSEFLKVVVQQMKKFCRDLRNTSKCGESLSNLMREGLKSTFSSSQNVFPHIGLFGEVFNEISSAQDILCDSLEQNFVVPLEKFYKETISETFTLKSQYKKERSIHDDKIIRYLQSDRGGHSQQVETRALDVVNTRKSLELTRYDLYCQINEVEAKKSFELSDTCIATMTSLKHHQRSSADRLDIIMSKISELTSRQEIERQMYLTSKSSIEQQRNNFLTVLDAMTKRAEYQVSATPTDAAPTINNLLSSDNFLLTEDGNMPSTGQMIGAASNAISKFSAMGVAIGANWIGGFHKRNNSATDLSDNNSRNNSLRKQKNNNNSNNNNNNNANSNTMLSPSNQSANTSTNDLNIIENSPSVSSINYSVEETEQRMKVLDKSDLEIFYSEDSVENFTGVLKQGYILEKVTGKIIQNGWYRRWLVLDDMKLSFVMKESSDSTEPLGIQILCDILLSSVRDVRNSETPFCFEVTYANMKTYTFQAEGLKSKEEWVDAIRSATEKRLIAGATPMNVVSNTSSYKPTTMSFSTSPAVTSMPVISSSSTLKLNYVDEILKSNLFCCECSKNDPDWVSLNLGCLVCIECSGVHRSLGVHLSKVRSLTLDDLEPEEYEVLRKLGNNINHLIWESGVDFDATSVLTSSDSISESDHNNNSSNIKKPTIKDDYASRDKFIRAKYINKHFMKKLDIATINAQLLDACKHDDVSSVLKCLAYGASVNGEVSTSKNTNTLQNGEYSIPILSAAQHGSITTVVLLILNGADVLLNSDNIDLGDDIVPALAVAKKYAQTSIVQYLTKKSELLGMTSSKKSSGVALSSRAESPMPTESIDQNKIEYNSVQSTSKQQSELTKEFNDE